VIYGKKKMQTSFEIIAVDDDNSFIDEIDGEFDNLEIALRYLELHKIRYQKDYPNPEDRGILKIRKITREILE
jgi:hypothetical protein